MAGSCSRLQVSAGVRLAEMQVPYCVRTVADRMPVACARIDRFSKFRFVDGAASLL
jgi:hypothetical protein